MAGENRTGGVPAGPLPPRAGEEQWRGTLTLPWQQRGIVDEVAVSRHLTKGLSTWRWFPGDEQWVSFGGEESAAIYQAWALALRAERDHAQAELVTAAEALARASVELDATSTALGEKTERAKMAELALGGLAGAVAAMAQDVGIYNGEVPLTGPHHLLLLSDVSGLVASMRDDIATLRAVVLAERLKMIQREPGWRCSYCTHFTRYFRCPAQCKSCNEVGGYSGSYPASAAEPHDHAALAALGDPLVAVSVERADHGRRLRDPDGRVWTVDDMGIAFAGGPSSQWRSVEGDFFPTTLPLGWRWAS